MDEIVILGFGGHAKSVADSILRTKKYSIVGYTDLCENKCSFEYLGTDEQLIALYKKGVRKAVLGIGFMGKSNIRDQLVSFAKKIGYEFPIIIDPSSVIAENVIIGEGTFIGKNVVINSDSLIGSYCILNTGAIIEHDDKVEDYSHLAVGTILCGNVHIGHHTMIGAGTTIIQEKKIGNNVIIGANSTVISDVGDNMKVYGIVK